MFRNRASAAAFASLALLAGGGIHAAEAGATYTAAHSWDQGGNALGINSTNVLVVPRYFHVDKVSPTGTVLSTFGAPGAGPGQFEGAGGADFDTGGGIWVSDASNHRVQKFTAGGSFVSAYGTQGSGFGQLDNPTDVATNALHQKAAGGGLPYAYIADYGNDRVVKVGLDGNLVHQVTAWGSTGDGNGQFELPNGIATDALGNVYVLEWDRVQKFTSNGQFVTKWGTQGDGNGQFEAASGITVDAKGYVYVVDSSGPAGARAQKFTSTGQFVASWTPNFALSGESNPGGGNGVAVNSYGDVFATFISEGDGITQGFDELSVPGTLQFGTVVVGNVATKTITVKNTSTINSIPIASATISGAGNQFTKVGDSCSGTVLAPGGTCTITIEFEPFTQGTKSGTLTLSKGPNSLLRKVALHGKGFEQI